MRRHSSLAKPLNIYQKQARKLIDLKFSPSYKLAHQPKTTYVKNQNSHFRKPIPGENNKLVFPQYELKKTFLSQLDPEKQQSQIPNVQQFRITLNKKLHDQANTLRQRRITSQEKQREFRENRKVKERLSTQEKLQQLQQIQYKRKERQRDQEVKLRRTTSERSFVHETLKETLSMIKNSRQARQRREIELSKEKHKQTEKQHQFLVIKKKTLQIHQRQEQKYKLAFVKNQPLPKYSYPNLNDMLTIASKTISTARSSYHPQSSNSVHSRRRLESLSKYRGAKHEVKTNKYAKKIEEDKQRGSSARRVISSFEPKRSHEYDTKEE